jgi:hypothetical protein
MLTEKQPQMSRQPASLQRTEWAERHVEDFLALPLVREFVFRSPQSLDKVIQKEVVDFLVAHGNTAILVSQKCQEDPSSRIGARAASWARKAAKGAASQLCGALRRADGQPIWCEHSRRGRVEFPNGLPKIDHAIALVEMLERVDLEPDAEHLPLEFQGTPITYLCLNDFLNLAVNLRTSSELLEYLDVRRSLPSSDLRIIGDERPLFECYLLEGPFLKGTKSRADATTIVARQQARLMATLAAKRKSDRYSTLLEHMADELARRLPDYAVNVPEPLLAHFDPPEARSGYLKMQGVLAGLRLRERAKLGEAFYEVISNLRPKASGFTYKSVWLDPEPDWVFVFASSKGVTRAEVLTRMKTLMVGAMAFYERHCFTAIDRGAEGYEVSMGFLGSPPTAAEQKIGQEFFGHLRTTTVPLRLGP